MGGVVVVTGAGSGLGQAIAFDLARSGMLVVCAGRRVDRLGRVVDQIRADGGVAEPLGLDVTDGHAVDTALRSVARAHHRIDVLINNAGVFAKNRLEKMSDEDWRSVLETNLTGAFLCTRATVQLMLEQQPLNGRRGHIVYINSGAGLAGYPTGASYSASKFGLLGLSDTVRQEYLADGIAVTDVIVAAMVDSELSTRERPGRLPAAVVGELVADVVRHRGRAVLTRVDLRALPLTGGQGVPTGGGS